MIKLKDLLFESKQSIINLGYPKIIVDLFYEIFGNKAYLMAKWFKDYHAGSYKDKKDWWDWVFKRFSSNKLYIGDMVDFYYASFDKEKYLKLMKDMEMWIDPDELYDEDYLKENRILWLKEIKKELSNDILFKYFNLTKDIISGKIKNLAPYDKMNFLDAEMKYNERQIFREATPLKVYNNGYKWINVGKRSHLMAHYMDNCGSVGVMSWDDDATMIGLFDPNNKPHVVVTYSPNEKRISGDQGCGSTKVKPEYHKYVLDLVKFLNVRFDVDKSKSKLLSLKYLFKNKAEWVKQIKFDDRFSFDEYFKIKMNGKIYYTDSFLAVSEEDMKKAAELIKSKQIELSSKYRSVVRSVFNHYNKEILKNFITYQSINQF